jgi:hypothetical protein
LHPAYILNIFGSRSRQNCWRNWRRKIGGGGDRCDGNERGERVKGVQEEKNIFGLFLLVVGYLIIREVSEGMRMLSVKKRMDEGMGM